MNTELTECLHDMRGALTVVSGFLRWLDSRLFAADGRDLYHACRISLERMETHLERMHDLAHEDLATPPPRVEVVNGALWLHPMR